MKRFIYILLLVSLNSSLSAQLFNKEKYSYSIGGSFMKGGLVTHSPALEPLSSTSPAGIIINLDQMTYGNKNWEYRFNYPEIGLSFIYLDYRNDIAGKSIGVIPHINFQWMKREKHLFKVQVGGGLSYNTNPYDSITNPMNHALGSHLSFAFNTAVIYQLKLNNSFSLETGLSFLHCSNGATKKPNKGANIFNTQIGVVYFFDAEKEKKFIQGTKEKNDNSISVDITLTTGRHEYSINQGLFNFYNTIALVKKQISFHSIGVGFNYTYSNAFRNQIEKNNEDKTPNILGATLGYELEIGKTALIVQGNFHFLHPFIGFKHGDIPFFLDIGYRYYFHRKLYVQAILETHFFVAQFSGIGLGIKL